MTQPPAQQSDDRLAGLIQERLYERFPHILTGKPVGSIAAVAAEVARDAIATAVVAGVDIAARVRDANQAERRRLEDALRTIMDSDSAAHSRVLAARALALTGERP